MTSRTVTLAVVLFTLSGALGGPGSLKVGAMYQRTEDGRGPVIDCKIQTSEQNWSLQRKAATVSVQIRVQGVSETTALLSLRLISVQKTSVPIQEAYWAPFDITTGSSTKKRQKLQSTGETNPQSVSLVPSQLLWAATTSSVWPSQALAKTVPPGKYLLQVQIELEGGKTVSSNDLEINIAK